MKRTKYTDEQIIEIIERITTLRKCWLSFVEAQLARQARQSNLAPPQSAETA